MARILGYFASQVDRLRCVCAAEDGARLERDARHGFGVGSHQGREVLLRRWPTGLAHPLDLAEVAGDLRSGSVLAQVRRATVGGRLPENTQPFRFRQWMFAALGTLPGGADGRARLASTMPSFLSDTLRGETDSEALFHHLLGALFRAGALDAEGLERSALRDHLAAGLASLDDLLGARAPLALLLSDGAGCVGFARSTPMRWLRRVGIARCPVCSGTAQPVAHETLRYALLADGEPSMPGWRPWGGHDDGAFVTVDRGFEVREARWSDLR